MGNSDIRTLGNIKETKQDNLSGKFVAVDASNWLYKYMTTTARFTDTESYTNNNGVELPNLIGVPQGIKKFIEYNVHPVFVFDGKPNDMKSDEIKRRKNIRDKAAKKAKESNNKIDTSVYQSRSQTLNDKIIKTTKELFEHLSVPYITAPQAAEAQTAYMTNTGDFYAAVTDDYDSLIFGAENTIRKYTTSESIIELMNLEKTLTNNNITYKKLILATILCGTDYNDGVSGVGPKTSLKLVKEHDTIKQLEEKLEVEIENGKEILELYMHPPITDDWPEPQRLNPNVEKTKQYIKNQGININTVESTLSKISENSTQTGLNSF